MKIIVLGAELPRSYSVEFDRRWLYLAAAALLVLLVLLLSFIYLSHERGQRIALAQTQLSQMQQDMLFDQRELQAFYNYSEGVFLEHAKQAGMLQARLARLEALGSRLADVADFSEDFDFYTIPAIGGPDQPLNEPGNGVSGDVLATLSQLNLHLDRREQELKAIDELLKNRQLERDRYLAGEPVASGWLSSRYGRRTDPFHGRVSFHRGMDYAGKEGTDILAVAAGVVVWSGEHFGYGNMVEINHGNGFVTRYAHNKVNNVKIGEIVEKGQVIAQMGSTGRATGTHLHFEVIKNGRHVDPRSYVYRRNL